MNEVITIGVDVAKSVFEVHGVDAEGGVVFRSQSSQCLPDINFKPGYTILTRVQLCWLTR